MGTHEQLKETLEHWTVLAITTDTALATIDVKHLRSFVHQQPSVGPCQHGRTRSTGVVDVDDAYWRRQAHVVSLPPLVMKHPPVVLLRSLSAPRTVCCSKVCVCVCVYTNSSHSELVCCQTGTPTCLHSLWPTCLEDTLASADLWRFRPRRANPHSRITVLFETSSRNTLGECALYSFNFSQDVH